jgi:hypothetical protein
MKVLRDDHQACIKRYNFSILIQNPELVEVLARSRSYAHPIRILLIMEVFLSTGTSPPTRRTVARSSSSTSPPGPVNYNSLYIETRNGLYIDSTGRSE